jgi:hypothetical protein
VQRSFYIDYLEKVRSYHATEPYKKAIPSGRSGSNRSLPKPKNGTAYVGCGCVG